jgi:hypothetical protein
VISAFAFASASKASGPVRSRDRAQRSPGPSRICSVRVAMAHLAPTAPQLCIFSTMGVRQAKRSAASSCHAGLHEPALGRLERAKRLGVDSKPTLGVFIDHFDFLFRLVGRTPVGRQHLLPFPRCRIVIPPADSPPIIRQLRLLGQRPEPSRVGTDHQANDLVAPLLCEPVTSRPSTAGNEDARGV